MQRTVFLNLAAFLSLTGAAFAQQRGLRKPVETFKASVFSFESGDTIIAMVDERKITVRLEGVDAPEPNQPLGDRAHNRLSDLLSGKEFDIEITRTDGENRAYAHIWIDGLHVNQRFLRDGLAWHSIRFNRDPLMAAAQVEAMKSHRGVWRDSSSIPPWDWRREIIEKPDPFEEEF